jgi:hypothetical protein
MPPRLAVGLPPLGPKPSPAASAPRSITQRYLNPLAELVRSALPACSAAHLMNRNAGLRDARREPRQRLGAHARVRGLALQAHGCRTEARRSQKHSGHGDPQRQVQGVHAQAHAADVGGRRPHRVGLSRMYASAAARLIARDVAHARPLVRSLSPGLGRERGPVRRARRGRTCAPPLTARACPGPPRARRPPRRRPSHRPRRSSRRRPPKARLRSRRTRCRRRAPACRPRAPVGPR